MELQIRDRRSVEVEARATGASEIGYVLTLEKYIGTERHLIVAHAIASRFQGLTSRLCCSSLLFVDAGADLK